MIQTVNEERKIKVRIPHNCSTCRERIEADTHAFVQVNKYDGAIYRWYTCYSCHQLLHKWPHHFEDDDERCFMEGCVAEYIANVYPGRYLSSQDLLFKLNYEKPI
jgi:hypothetical protein